MDKFLEILYYILKEEHINLYLYDPTKLVLVFLCEGGGLTIHNITINGVDDRVNILQPI